MDKPSKSDLELWRRHPVSEWVLDQLNQERSRAVQALKVAEPPGLYRAQGEVRLLDLLERLING